MLFAVAAWKEMTVNFLQLSLEWFSRWYHRVTVWAFVVRNRYWCIVCCRDHWDFSGIHLCRVDFDSDIFWVIVFAVIVSSRGYYNNFTQRKIVVKGQWSFSRTSLCFCYFPRSIFLVANFNTIAVATMDVDVAVALAIVKFAFFRRKPIGVLAGQFVCGELGRDRECNLERKRNL